MDERKKKKLSIGISSAIALILLLLFIIFTVRKNNYQEEDTEYGGILYKGIETQYGDKENLGYYTSTGSKEDVDDIPEDITNAVFLYNESVLADNGLDIYGINSLDEYLLRYINYYIGEGVYKITVVDNSFKDDQNYPEFDVRMEDEGYLIRCMYRRGEQRYSFECQEIQK